MKRTEQLKDIYSWYAPGEIELYYHLITLDYDMWAASFNIYIEPSMKTKTPRDKTNKFTQAWVTKIGMNKNCIT